MEELEITEKNFKEEVLSKEKYVLLEFYGTWCMPCKMEAKILDKVEEEHKDVKVVRLDIDKNMSLAKEYGVMTVPTMLYFKDEFECEKTVGFRQFNQINEIINNLKN